MKKLLPLLFMLPLVIMSCSKKVECDNARICVKNNRSDTIYYCWGCNRYDNALPPGELACRNVGEIEISRNYESTSIVSFDMAGSSIAMKVEECDDIREID